MADHQAGTRRARPRLSERASKQQRRRILGQICYGSVGMRRVLPEAVNRRDAGLSDQELGHSVIQSNGRQADYSSFAGNTTDKGGSRRRAGASEAGCQGSEGEMLHW